MARQEPLTLIAPISPRLAEGLVTIQSVFETWARQSELRRGLPPVFRTVPVDGPTRDAAGTEPRAARACFFSGGVDSLATAIAHRDEDLTLVYVHGLDVPLDDPVLRDLAAGTARRAAEGLGLPLIEVETSVRSFTDVYVDWMDAHGAALAGAALLLGGRFGRVYVPASATYATLAPLGSHPLVDPWWPTERVEIVHDGCAQTRVDKLRAIAGEAVARETLRVCVRTDSTDLYCGRCWKCVLTIAGVRALDMEDRFPTLPRLTDAEFVRRMIGAAPATGRLPAWDRQRAEWIPFLAAATPAERRVMECGLTLRYAFGVGRVVVGRTRARAERVRRSRDSDR
jgi:hypothetical protein